MLSAPALGYIHVEKHENNVYKVRLKEIVLKLAANMGKVIRAVDINICPQGAVCPCPRAVYMYKSIKIYTRCQVSVYRTTGSLV